jgi:hypothetical protein
MDREVDATPGTTATVSFRIRATAPGSYEGVVSLPEDGLAVDNQRFFTLNVAKRVQATLLTDASLTSGTSSARFLYRAIDPTGGDGVFDVRAMRPGEFDVAVMQTTQVVLIDGVSGLSRETADLLAQFVRDGGAAILFLGSPGERNVLDELEAASNNEFLSPVLLGSIHDYRSEENREDPFATIAFYNEAAPALQKFRETDDLSSIQFYRAFEAEPRPEAGEILLRFDDGNIAAMQRSFGAGTMLVCNFSAARDHSNLAGCTVFVPLIHELLKGTRPRTGSARTFLVGGAASTTVQSDNQAGPLSFVNPAGESVVAQFEESGGDTAVMFPQTSRIGFYRVQVEEQHIGSVAVNVDSRESNLDSLDTEQLEQVARLSRDRMTAVAGYEASAVDDLLRGRPVWHYFVLGALALVALEQFVLMALRR